MRKFVVKAAKETIFYYFCNLQTDHTVPCYRSFAFSVKDESALPFVLPSFLPIALTCAPRQRQRVQHDCGGRRCAKSWVVVCVFAD